MSKTKLKRTKKSASTINYSLIFAIIITAALVLTVYQAVNGNFQLGARAGDCGSYTKRKPFGEATGIVKSVGEDRFVWNLNGDTTKPKTVVICGGTSITRQFGGAMTLADIGVGDKVDLMGWYGDATNTTILPTWVRDASTSMAKEVTSKVAEVDPLNNSLVLDAVNMKFAGKFGVYKLNVLYNSATKCFAGTKNNTKRSIECSTIAVGKTAEVSGLLDDQTLTMTATQIGVK
ncbi:hypothetical protein HYU90_03455 [Candidatus Collierbacteria bacterium]|nr:hypothetical protein [Candidatus Collierbacteria bacterium]